MMVKSMWNQAETLVQIQMWLSDGLTEQCQALNISEPPFLTYKMHWRWW